METIIQRESSKSEARYYSGTSGLVLPVRNKQSFPIEFQEKSRLAYYASIFNSVEINSSFYKVPMASTVAKWAADVPEHFRFTFKLWREITHVKSLTFKEENVSHFIDVIDRVGDKRGCLLVQFPPSLKISGAPQLEKLLVSIKKADPENKWKAAIEFRERSWYHEDIYELLNEYKASLVIQDKPSSATPMHESETDFIYLRFHGPGGGYRGTYADDFLYEYAGYIQEWKSEGKDVYTYFNNTMGEAVKNLQTLNQIVDFEQYE